MEFNESDSVDSPMTSDFMKGEWSFPPPLNPIAKSGEWDAVQLRDLTEFIMSLVWLEFAVEAQISKRDVGH